MDALILAAGCGSRMGSAEKPKCLLDIGGTTIIDYQISCFKNIGIERIFVVTGYRSELIRTHLKNKAIFLHNPNYATSNNLYSIWAAKEILDNDFVCVYGDLFFHKQILQKCINDTNDICLVIEKNLRDETMKARIINDHVLEVNKSIPKEIASGNFIGMAKFRKRSIPAFINEVSKLVNDGDRNSYYTSAIESMIKSGQKVSYVETANLIWFDIDEKHELEEARQAYQKMIESEL